MQVHNTTMRGIIMILREKMDIAKETGEPIGILGEREKTELIRGIILEVGEDYCMMQPEGASFFGFNSLLIPLSGIVFLT